MKKLDHVGIAVHSLEDSITFFRDILGLVLIGIEDVETEGVRVAFLNSGETKIELLQPIKEGAIATYLEKKGQGIHHMAFLVEDLEDEISQLKKMGVKLIHDVPKNGASGKKIAFIHPKSSQSVLIELCQEGE